MLESTCRTLYYFLISSLFCCSSLTFSLSLSVCLSFSGHYLDLQRTPSTHKSNARSSCPFCKRECHSSDLSSHLLRCRPQQASRDNVWRDAKKRQQDQRSGGAPSSVGRKRHQNHATARRTTPKK